MSFSTVGITITLSSTTGSAAFETKRLIVLHDRPMWLGRAENSDNRAASTTNGWFYSDLLDDKMAMLYLFRNEVIILCLQTIIRISFFHFVLFCFRRHINHSLLKCLFYYRFGLQTSIHMTSRYSTRRSSPVRKW